MDIGSFIYDLYYFWINNFNRRRKDDKELPIWLKNQIKYESYDGGVVLQINEYDGDTVDDYIHHRGE